MTKPTALHELLDVREKDVLLPPTAMLPFRGSFLLDRHHFTEKTFTLNKALRCDDMVRPPHPTQSLQCEYFSPTHLNARLLPLLKNTSPYGTYNRRSVDGTMLPCAIALFRPLLND